MRICFHRYRKVYIHQRGWGKSTPAGSVENNDVESILNDCEDVRIKLNIGENDDTNMDITENNT